MRYLVLALVAVALICGARGMTIRKNLVSDRQSIDADWAEVDATLTRRAAVIPNLLDVVRADAPDEAAATDGLEQARQALAAASGPQSRIQANTRLDQAMARLMLRMENHPRIEHSKKYNDLLEALRSADYQIALARRKYNEAVEHYNARIDLFPDNIVASVARLGKIDTYFRTPAI